MRCSTSVDTSLGEFDASRVRDLGLPTITALEPVGSDGPGPSTPTPDPLPSTPAKFQLGETLPVVSARIVRRILRGDFVDMAELTEENLELELRRSLEGDEGKPLPAHKLRPVPDLLSWVRSFCHFAGIVARTHPSKAVDLWAYMAIMVSGGEKGDWWRAYDSRFRQQLTSLDKAEFGRLDQALYTRSLLATAAGGAPKTSNPPPHESSAPRTKKRRVAACFAFNDGRACAATPCRYQHICSRCSGDHRRSACGYTGEGSLQSSSSH